MVNKQRVSNVYFQRQCKFQIGIFPVIFICIIRKYFSITLKERRVYYRRQNLFLFRSNIRADAESKQN